MGVRQPTFCLLYAMFSKEKSIGGVCLSFLIFGKTAFIKGQGDRSPKCKQICQHHCFIYASILLLLLYFVSVLHPSHQKGRVKTINFSPSNPKIYECLVHSSMQNKNLSSKIMLPFLKNR